MHLNVVHHIASIPIAGKLRVFSVMGYNAEFGHLGVVFFARKCGIFFSFMLELVKNLNVTYLDAGLLLKLVVGSINSFPRCPCLLWFDSLGACFSSRNVLHLQRFERTSKAVATAV